MKTVANLHHWASGNAMRQLSTAVTVCLALALILPATVARAQSYVETKLTASDPPPWSNVYYGSSVAISGNTVIVEARLNDDGAPDDDDLPEEFDSGSAYIFSRKPVADFVFDGDVRSQLVREIASRGD